VQPPVHDVTDGSVLRSWLNSPLGASLDADIFKVLPACRVAVVCRCAPAASSARAAGSVGLATGLARLQGSAPARVCLLARERGRKLLMPWKPMHGAGPQATNVIRTFAKAHLMSPDRAIPPAVLRDAAGFAILTVAKARPRPALRRARREKQGFRHQL